MDSLLSGGKGRKRALTAADMNVQLPCSSDAFAFGEAVRCERLDGSLALSPQSLPTGELGIIAWSMRIADIWGSVARWACATGTMYEEEPWAPSSHFGKISSELESWRSGLPLRCQYEVNSLHAHNGLDQGQAFCYMWLIYFMSIMFLHRAYLPVLGPQQTLDGTSQFVGGSSQEWRDWRKQSRRVLFSVAAIVCEMMEEMRSFGVYFCRGLVPWCGFAVYTAVGVMLYCHNFPSEVEDPEISKKAREKVVNGCTFLKELNSQWPMANQW